MTNWKKYKILDIGEVIGGATPSTKNDAYYGGDIPWITPKDLSGFSGRFISRGERNLTKEGLESCSAKLLPKHSILFSSRAPIGYVAIAENELCTNQGFKSVVPNNEKVDYMFLYYLLKHNKSSIEALGSGTTFKEVSGSVLRNFEVLVPPLSEQKAIADVLSALDDKIEINNQINQKLEEMAQTIFKSWFVDFEPFQDGEFEDSELGMIPKGWRVREIGEVIDVRDGTHDSPKQSTDGYPLVTSKHLRPFGIDFSDTYLISKEDYDKVNQRSQVEKNDILISMIGTVGIVCLVWYESIDFAIKNVGLFRTSQRSDLFDYIYLYLKSTRVMAHIDSRMAGSTQKYISLGELRKIPIIIPSEAVLLCFKKLVGSLFIQLFNNLDQNCKFEALRETLMPKLINGEIRVGEGL